MTRTIFNLIFMVTFSIFFLLMLFGCASVRQYTIPHDIDDGLLYERPSPLRFHACANCDFMNYEDISKKEIVFNDVKLKASSYERCLTDTFFLILPLHWDGGCGTSGRNVYVVTVNITNISSKPIMLNPDKISINDKEKIIDYNFVPGDIPSAIEPNENIKIRMNIGDWNKVENIIYLDIGEALSTKEEIKIKMERFTTTTLGLLMVI